MKTYLIIKPKSFLLLYPSALFCFVFHKVKVTETAINGSLVFFFLIDWNIQNIIKIYSVRRGSFGTQRWACWTWKCSSHVYPVLYIKDAVDPLCFNVVESDIKTVIWIQLSSMCSKTLMRDLPFSFSLRPCISNSLANMLMQR